LAAKEMVVVEKKEASGKQRRKAVSRIRRLSRVAAGAESVVDVG
jgi:hypothetical protein